MNTQAVNFDTWSQNTCFLSLVAAGSQRRTEDGRVVVGRRKSGELHSKKRSNMMTNSFYLWWFFLMSKYKNGGDGWENKFIRGSGRSLKLCWKPEISVRVGGGDAERETGSVKLPSRDVYQGFLAHEAEGLREKRRKERRKRKKTTKKDIWHFWLFLNKHPRV